MFLVGEKFLVDVGGNVLVFIDESFGRLGFSVVTVV